MDKVFDNKFLKNFLYTFGILSVLFLSLLVYAFIRPAALTPNNTSYHHEGLFSYSATATPGLYDMDTVQPGEPISPKLTCLLNVGLSYSVQGNQVQGMTGTHQLYARVVNVQSGWQRTLPVTPETNFTGTAFFNSGVIDLCYVESLIALGEQETGLQTTLYTLEIVSPVTMSAIISGEQISDEFVPVLKFKYDKVHYYLDTSTDEPNPLFFSKPGASNNVTILDNTIKLLGLTLSVQTVRTLSVVGLLLSLCSILAVGIYIYKSARKSQEDMIQRKYGSLIVDIYEGSFELTPPVLDVTTIDSLAKLAERHNTMILHIAHDFLHDYVVQGYNATYRFSASGIPNNKLAKNSVPPADYDQVFANSQSQYTHPKQPQQDFGDSNENQSYYDLDDTQPTRAEPRMYRID